MFENKFGLGPVRQDLSNKFGCSRPVLFGHETHIPVRMGCSHIFVNSIPGRQILPTILQHCKVVRFASFLSGKEIGIKAPLCTARYLATDELQCPTDMLTTSDPILQFLKPHIYFKKFLCCLRNFFDIHFKSTSNLILLSFEVPPDNFFHKVFQTGLTFWNMWF